jgi:hypothetical protein
MWRCDDWHALTATSQQARAALFACDVCECERQARLTHHSRNKMIIATDVDVDVAREERVWQQDDECIKIATGKTPFL